MGLGAQEGNRCRLWSWGVVILMALSLVACKKEPPERAIVVGPWKETVASFHTITTFRANGSFSIIRLVEGQLSMIDETAEKVKVDGKWQLLPPEVEGDPLLLVMTPEGVVGETSWEVDAPVTYLIEQLTPDRMMMRSPAGERLAWDRLKSTKTPDGENGIAAVHVVTGPMVVGLAKERLNEESRYLCVQLDITMTDVEGATHVEEERLPSGKPSGLYRLHPSIHEALVLRMSRLTHRDVRSLNHFQDVVTDFKSIIAPYLGDRFQDVKVVKVVVTSSKDGVDAFVAEFTPVPEGAPASDS